MAWLWAPNVQCLLDRGLPLGTEGRGCSTKHVADTRVDPQAGLGPAGDFFFAAVGDVPFLCHREVRGEFDDIVGKVSKKASQDVIQIGLLGACHE